MAQGLLLDTDGTECCCPPPPLLQNCQEFEADRFGTCGQVATMSGGSWTGIRYVINVNLDIQEDFHLTGPLELQPSGTFDWIAPRFLPGCLDIGTHTHQNFANPNQDFIRPICACTGFQECSDFHGFGSFTGGNVKVSCDPFGPPPDRWRWELGSGIIQYSSFPGCPSQAEPWVFGAYPFPPGSFDIDLGTFTGPS